MEFYSLISNAARRNVKGAIVWALSVLSLGDLREIKEAQVIERLHVSSVDKQQLAHSHVLSPQMQSCSFYQIVELSLNTCKVSVKTKNGIGSLPNTSFHHEKFMEHLSPEGCWNAFASRRVL